MSECENRHTRQRQLILDVICGNLCHPTADEIYDLVRRDMPKISLGTVYRNLDYLEKSGHIISLTGEGPRRYDGNTAPHLHIRCACCKRTDDVPGFSDGQLYNLKQAIHEKCGYRVTDFVGEFSGICPECRKKAFDSGNTGKNNNNK